MFAFPFPKDLLDTLIRFERKCIIAVIVTGSHAQKNKRIENLRVNQFTSLIKRKMIS